MSRFEVAIFLVKNLSLIRPSRFENAKVTIKIMLALRTEFSRENKLNNRFIL